MSKRVACGMVVLLVAAAAIAAGLSKLYPGLWVQLDHKVAQAVGWTEEARKADPVGFADYAREKLRNDLEAMEKSRRELGAEIGQLSSKLREQQALRNHACGLADEFRVQYQVASTNDRFPVMVRDAAYTEDQVKSQVSMLLSEAEGYEAAVAKLQQVKEEAELRLEALTVRINDSEAQVRVLSVQREMLKAQLLSDEGEKLLTKVDELLHDNARIIKANPVRNVRELLTATHGSNRNRTKADIVAAFLTQKPARSEQVVRGQDQTEYEQVERNSNAQEPVPVDQTQEVAPPVAPATGQQLEEAVDTAQESRVAQARKPKPIVKYQEPKAGEQTELTQTPETLDQSRENESGDSSEVSPGANSNDEENEASPSQWGTAYPAPGKPIFQQF